jgi:hypothetical protein
MAEISFPVMEIERGWESLRSFTTLEQLLKAQ